MTTVAGTPAPSIELHAWAWWWWALCAATAISFMTNPLGVALIGAAVTVVAIARRSDAPWARSVAGYFVLAATVLGIRLIFQILFGGGRGSIVLVRLPQLALPTWMAGVRIGGPVTLEAVLASGYDGLRLGAMLLSLGAANALANPKRALRSVPAALYEASVAVVIALSVAPQLIESTGRVRRARRLRGSTSGWHAVRAVVVPVLEDAVERSMALAASMESRGFGRTGTQDPRSRLTTGGLLMSALLMTLGGFLLLSGTQNLLAGVILALSAAGVVLGLRESGRRLRVTHYRPDAWGVREWLILAQGAALVALIIWLKTTAPLAMDPSTFPLIWPPLHPAMSVAALLTLAPLVVTRRVTP